MAVGFQFPHGYAHRGNDADWTAATLALASEPVVLFAGGIASSETYGDESEPFDSWFMTYVISAGHDFDSRKPVGTTIVFR